MRDTFAVAVRNAGDQLVEVGAGDGILERTGESKEIEQLTTGGQLQHHEDHGNLRAVLLLVDLSNMKQKAEIQTPTHAHTREQTCARATISTTRCVWILLTVSQLTSLRRITF
jgi:hypothetical protein